MQGNAVAVENELSLALLSFKVRKEYVIIDCTTNICKRGNRQLMNS